jgi:hypothetical protein
MNEEPKLRMESSAVEQEVPGGASFERTDSLITDNVSSIADIRRARAIDDAVKAYFDAMVMEDVPDELTQLVIGLR